MNVGSIVKEIVSVTVAPTAIVGIGVFKVAAAPAAVQFASAKTRPVGIASITPTVNASTLP